MIEIFITMLIAYFACGSVIAVVSRKLLKKGFEEFVVGGYRVGGFLSAMTYAATTYSAFMMVGLVGLTYALGVASLGFELVYLAATIGILVTIGPEVWRKARVRKWVSPSEMIGELYGSKALALLISILYLITLTPYLAAQFKGIGEIFNAIGLGYEVGIAFTAFAVFLWIAIAGLWSVATTDAFQGFWMIITSMATMVWVIGFLLPSAKLSLFDVFNVLTNIRLSEGLRGNLLGFTWTTSMFIGMSIPWVFFALTNPQVVQRLYIPKDANAFKKMVKYFAVYGFAYTLLCIFLGLIFRSYIAVAHPDLELYLARARDSVTPTILLKGPTLLASATFIGIIAAAVSTANSIALTAASAVAQDLYRTRIKNVREGRAIAVVYMGVAIMVFIASLIALYRIAYIVELSVTSSALLLTLAPITTAGVYLEPKRRGLPYVLTSLILGLSVASVSTIIYGPLRALSVPLFMGMPTPFWVLVLSSLPIAVLVLRAKERSTKEDKENQ